MPTPKFPKYERDSLRPNPTTADPSRGVLAFAQETIMVGDFGSWDARASVVNGLPPASTGAGGRGRVPKDEQRVKAQKMRRPAELG